MRQLPRWLLLNHVPAGLNLSNEQVAELRNRVRTMRSSGLHGKGVGRSALKRLVPGIAALVVVFVVWLEWLIGARLPTAHFVIANTLGVLVFQGLMWIVIAWSINRAMAPVVWRALNQTGCRICEGCGYIIEYLPLETSKCPECGEVLRPPTNASS